MKLDNVERFEILVDSDGFLTIHKNRNGDFVLFNDVKNMKVQRFSLDLCNSGPSNDFFLELVKDDEGEWVKFADLTTCNN